MNAPIPAGRIRVGFETHPERYNHWKLGFEGPLATLTLDVAEDKGIAPGYKLKLNSYDLGVDIELHDALNRIRFEHPEVKCVVLTSGKSRMFCSGANIYMLGLSPHSWKVNFCKFTNETRNGIEDSSAHSGLKFLAALNGTTAGGGYEVALACDEIALVDDRSTTVSLPEVPLLGVLPGTGGLTRLVDKRKVRRDLADVFCTTAEGVRADRAKDWKLVDHIAKPQQFAEMVKARALELAKRSDRPGGKGVELTPLARREDESGLHYSCVEVHLNRSARTATITVAAPEGAQPQTPEQMLAAGADWWPLKVARELDDAILSLRHNELEIGLWLLKTRGSARGGARDGRGAGGERQALVRARDDRLPAADAGAPGRLEPLDVRHRRSGLVLRRHARRAAVRGRPRLHAAPAGRRTGAPHLVLSKANFGLWPMVSGVARIEARFCEVSEPVEAARQAIGEKLDAHDALELGLVTAAPDDLDWEDEIRLAIEERASLSPDALTGMEASLRFSGRENMADAHLRPPHRLAELDLHPAQRGRRAGRAQGLRQRRQAEIQLGARLAWQASTTTSASRTTSSSRATSRCSARSSTGSPSTSSGGARWGPRSRRRWTSTCAPRSASSPRAGRTTTTCGCRTTAGASSSPPRRPNRQVNFGVHKGDAAWQDVPGEYRSTLRRIIVTQGDTEPASVEQQRHLGLTCPSLYDLRNLFQVNVEEGRHLWAMVYLLHAYFGRDGREEAEALLERRSGDADNPRILTAFNEKTPDWLSFFMFTFLTDRDGKYQLAALAESAFDPLSRTCRFMLTEEAHHLFVGETGIARIIQRTCDVMNQHKTDDPARLRGLGVIDLPTLQKYLNFHFSVTSDLYGSEISSNAASFYTQGLKGRFDETHIGDDHRLESRRVRGARRRRGPRRRAPRAGADGAQRAPARRLDRRRAEGDRPLEPHSRQGRRAVPLQAAAQGLQPPHRPVQRAARRSLRQGRFGGRMDPPPRAAGCRPRRTAPSCTR